MIQWNIAFGILLIEIFVCLLVVLPLPLGVRRSILLGLAKVWNQPTVNIVLKTVFGFICILFVDSLRTIYYFKEDHHHDHHAVTTFEAKSSFGFVDI